MPPIPAAALKNVTLTGPIWSAEVDVLALAEPGDWAFRSLLIDLMPRQGLGQPVSLLPGTMILLGLVQRVQIRPDGRPASRPNGQPDGPVFEWRRADQPPTPASITDLPPSLLRQMIAEGKWSLLLVQADPARWSEQISQRYFPPTLTCLVGEIFLGLGGIEAPAPTVQALYERLRLQPAIAEFEQRHNYGENINQNEPQPSRLLSQIAVHSSGLSLYGRVQIPWLDGQQTLAAPFLVTEDFPLVNNQVILRLRPEKERFTPAETESWVNAWQQLSREINPGRLNALVDQPVPQWVTLELTTPDQVPDFWLIAGTDASGLMALRFEPDEFSLIISDRPPYDGKNPPESLARVAPAQVMISLTDGDRLIIDFDTQADFDMQAQPPAADSVAEFDQLTYQYEAAAAAQEFFASDQLRTAFSPVEVPRFLRRVQGRPEAEFALDDSNRQPRVLWGFMPLENGWAQLPFANLSEQLYLDRALDRAANSSADAATSLARPLLQGAVSLGNEAVLGDYPQEQPWNLTWTDADRISGQWRYSRAASGLALSQIGLTIHNPTLVLNGLFWLSAQAPRLSDALPDLDNWVNGLRSFALKTARPDRDLFPSPLLMAVQRLRLQARGQTTPSAALSGWRLTYSRDERQIERAGQRSTVFEHMVRQQILPASFLKQIPLVWQRHDQLPMVQALPLTQSQTPPNYPSASRQLLPYEVRPAAGGEPLEGLEFAATGAATWLRLDDSRLVAATDWRTHPDLPLVALSLPGLLRLPAQTNGQTNGQTQGLAWQYRFDLPYTDEINAFAQLPKLPQPPEVSSPLPQSPPPEPPPPLIRDTYSDYWQRLSQQASLASGDGVAAFDATFDQPSSTGGQQLYHLIEPYVWSVQVSSELASYPGKLTLRNGEGSGESSEAGLELSGDRALEGISGQFAISGQQLTRLNSLDPASNGSLTVTAGSLVAQLTPQGLRDQRGLIRDATQPRGSWFQTPVLFHKTENQEIPYALTSSAQPVSLQVADRQWDLWFRDLPLRLAAAAQTETGQFRRTERLSDQVQDVNDPESRSRELDFLSGYEWRLADPAAQSPAGQSPAGQSPANQPYLALFHLHFYPLTLEQVSLNGGAVEQVTMIGRLQLPLAAEQELEDFSNAVRLEFAIADGELKLTAVALVDAAQGEWPLALKRGEAYDAPLLVWRAVELSGDRLLIKDAALRFVLFQHLWTVPLDQAISPDAAAPFWLRSDQTAADPALAFSPDQTTLAKTYRIPYNSSAFPHLVPQTLTFDLNLDTGSHAVNLDLAIRLGPADTIEARNSFTALVQFPLLARGSDPRPRCRKALLLDQLWIVNQPENDAANAGEQTEPMGLGFDHTSQSFQFHWQTATLPDGTVELPELFPGMPLRPAQPISSENGNDNQAENAVQLPLPGFATLTFRLDSIAGDGADRAVPNLVLATAFVEALLFCEWGRFLQADAQSTAQSNAQSNAQPTGPDLAIQVFGSSAGNLTCSYTADWPALLEPTAAAQIELNQLEPEQLEPKQAGPEQLEPEQLEPEQTGPIWQETLIFNGMIEIKNLISWPQDLAFDEEANALLLPSLPQDPAQRRLNHRRHSLRILLNQHLLPLSQLVQRPRSAEVIFPLSADAVWEFLAVVEHQLIDIATDLTTGQPQLGADRRWTVTQPIRWLTPLQLKNHLAKLNQVYSPDPSAGIAQGGAGFFDPALQQALLAELESLLQQARPLLLIEASAHLWLNQTPLANLSPTTLQFLPSGAQLGILSSPAQYGPSDPQRPDWLLITLPFLGRLQLPSADGLNQTAPEPESAPEPEPASPLQVDPILCLQHQQPAPLALMLATWQPPAQDGLPIHLPISSFDTAAGRTWARLDPVALQESWFRLHHPVPEPGAQRLQSVIATQPDSPARLSRLAALTQNLASFRQTVPPATRPDGPLSPQSINQVIKTEGLSSRVTPPSNPPAGLQVLYLFQGGSGRTVADVSGVGEPLNLDLTERASDGQAAHWQWEPDGLRLLRPSALIANRPATKLIAACRASNELSIEAWIELDAAQTRASRLLPIVTLSHDPNNRYFTLAQGSNSDQPGDGFTVRLRTEHITNSDGTRLDRSAPLASSGTAKPGLSHLLVTRRADGTLKFYLDGQERASSRVENSLFPVYSGQNTDQTFRLGLANEILGERPWLGKYYWVAVYSRALTEAEVRSQFAQGPFARPTVSAPTRPESPLPLPVGLQALYLFQGSGTRVADQAGAGAPLDLELTQSPNPDNGQGDFWRWQEDGLEIRRPAVLRSRQPATRLISACKASDELTLEVWVKPLRADQGEGNPARIVTLSAGTSYRNFSLQQGLWQPNGTTQNRYGVRLRTTTRQDQQDNLNGEPFLAAASVVPAPETVHLVYTRAADGAAKLYINGVEQASVTAGGSFDNWDDSFELRLANELTNDRPWLGTYHRVAIYSRALTAAEVRSQFGRGYSLSQIAPHPWSSTGLQFATSRLLSQISPQPSPAAPALTRFAAATLLPTLPATAQVQPQSLASSPYLGVMFQPALQPLADRYRQSLVSSELLCLDRATHSLRPVSSHFWELPDPNLSDAPIVSEAEIYANSLKIYANSLTWAKSLHARLCPESPVAVLRYREIRRLIAPSPSDPASLAPPEAEPAAMPPVAPIITTYSYQIVPVAIAELPLQRVFQLRSRPAQLRFSEGQWGGTRLPLSLQPFELAPPQTTGVQPLYLQSRPDDPTLWPWGLSALRVSVRHTPASVTGRLNPESNLENGSDNDPGSNSGSDRTLWWQAPQYSVQYRTAKSGVTAGLPALFRARAITSLLPTAPQPPLPTIAVSETFAADADATANWQAILPSTMRYLLLGSRSGLFFNLRNQLLRQGQLTPQTLTSGSVFVSGSLPVQHRMPRPVPLPPNINPDLALQPWASFFQPRQTVWVADSPTDTAFLGANLLQNQPPRGLRLQLLVPQLGAVPPNWNGYLKFGLVNYRGTDPQLAQALDWQIGQVSALVGAQTFSFSQLAYDLQLLTSDAPLPEQGQARISLGKEGSAYRVRIFDSQGERVFDQSAVALPLPDRLAQSLNAAFENPGQDIRNIQAEIQAEIQRELVQAFTGSLEFKLFNGLQALMDRLALRGAGSTLNLQARVKPRPVAGHTDDGFEQSLSFTLRLTSDRTLPLPLQPRFLQFEDPEYNRQLASPTAHVSTQVAANLSSDPAAAAQLIGLRLAADRREYNPDSLLTWRYDWATNAAELDKLFTVRLLQIQRLRSGLPAPLVLPSSALLKTGTIYQIPLAQLTLPTSSSPTPAGSILQPGDVLQLTLSINKPDPAQPNLPVPTVRLVLTVAIVAEPVQPAPEAAYGLLRQNPDGSVECVRFAWSVLPNRVDLINPDDLKTEVVRRRALFQWTDTVRPHADIRYALQKITQTGSTACNPF